MKQSKGVLPPNKTMQINKAIIPIAGIGTRFLPLSKVVPKTVWPLVDKPVLQYIVEEVKASGIWEIIFVVDSARNNLALNYFKKNPALEKLLEDRGKKEILAQLKNVEQVCEGLSFSYVLQKEPLGDGHALLQTKKLLAHEPCAVSWADDVVEADKPCLLQLCQVFKTCQKPVLALARLPKERLSSYGVVEKEKIANRVYKIKKIVEKPEPGSAPSDLAIVGKYILTSQVFDYLGKAEPSPERGEIILADVLQAMLTDGKVIYGYEFNGKWLECGKKMDWLCSHFYLSLKHPQFGSALRKYLS